MPSGQLGNFSSSDSFSGRTSICLSEVTSALNALPTKLKKKKKPTYENNKGLHFPTSPKNAQTKFIFQPVPNPRAAFFDHVEKGIQ
jgi:hypothetical protein